MACWCLSLCLFFFFHGSCSAENIKLRESLVSRGCLLPSDHCHRPWCCLPLSFSLYLCLCLSMQTTFSKNPSCLIIQLHSVCGFKQHPVLGIRLSHFVAFIIWPGFGCGSDCGTDTQVIFHTLEIIHKLTQNTHCQKSCSFTLLIMDIMNNESQQLWLGR